MISEINNNEVFLIGTMDSELTYSHEVYGEGFYSFYLKIFRLSNICDRINVTVSERLIKEITLEIERNKTPLLDIENEDENYTGKSIALDETNRDLLERLVMGEAGTQGYIGAALVAQTIHDTMLYEDNYSVLDIKKEYAYAGELDTEPNEDVKKAVAYIFDDGKMAVQHELRYFYAPKLTDSYFHENQNFVVEYKGHRFFMEQTKE